MTWFTADTHFSHGNIVRLCQRPFKDAKDQDRRLTLNWNERVGPTDTVYHLGDFFFSKCSSRTAETLIRHHLEGLNGQIHLVAGNHDYRHSRVYESLVGLSWDTDDGDYGSARGKLVAFHPSGQLQVELDEELIVMNHCAMRVWNKSHYGSWNLHGHSHGTLPPLSGRTDHHGHEVPARQMDVGVDCHEFYPVSFEYIRQYFHLPQT